MVQGFLRDVVVVKVRVSMQCGFEVLCGFEMVGLQYLGNPAIEALDHAVGLGVAWRYQAMLDVLFGAGAIKGVLP